MVKQTLSGKQFVVKDLKEMEVWALEAYGAAHVLRELRQSNQMMLKVVWLSMNHSQYVPRLQISLNLSRLLYQNLISGVNIEFPGHIKT